MRRRPPFGRSRDQPALPRSSPLPPEHARKTASAAWTWAWMRMFQSRLARAIWWAWSDGSSRTQRPTGPRSIRSCSIAVAIRLKARMRIGPAMSNPILCCPRVDRVPRCPAHDTLEEVQIRFVKARTMKTLIADDDLASRIIAQTALEWLGHDCHAWDTFRSWQPEVVISDWKMPGM